MVSILNEIIEIGGTTAFEKPLSSDELIACYLTGEQYLHCVLAEVNGTVSGFQSLTKHKKLAHDWADIATFARVQPKTPGVGTALFNTTRAYALENKIVAINATIRADNIGGLRYYSKMGFEQYSIASGIPLLDGTPVDRVSMKYKLT